MIRLEARPVFEAGALLGEGPVWHGAGLLWVDIPDGKVMRSQDGRTRTMKVFGSPVSAVLPRRRGGYVALHDLDVAVLDADFHELGRISVLQRETGLRLSDGAVGPGGELWFGSMRHDLAAGGSLFRLRAGESAPTEVRAGLGMPNGMAFSPDGRSLYLVDSVRRAVTVLDYDPETQDVSGDRVLIEVDPDLGTPDGIAVDAGGGIWVAMWAGGRLRRIELDGTWSQEILVPARNVTSCAFGGAGLQTLYITTGTVDLGVEEARQQPTAGSVFGISLPIGGLPQEETEL
ncbi:SMP-30/gluconolactonase/LRE family protein [Microbacterium esteraromaticum]|uniref:SMP-30/gluconolactonase/LRE family protein n=1 Tax=Microbacterium esteraromaticum TaxID=57043 RepID=A0A7D7WBY0_9MICO|nr:SMP-30/gluconolactonase/LRE family protein [Microbacterium esteraromaticum]QMU96012.1 SMP-30/gluconolactonase/LRE family protein [Microbacterium esteraromaticum]